MSDTRKPWEVRIPPDATPGRLGLRPELYAELIELEAVAQNNPMLWEKQSVKAKRSNQSRTTTTRRRKKLEEGKTPWIHRVYYTDDNRTLMATLMLRRLHPKTPYVPAELIAQVETIIRAVGYKPSKSKMLTACEEVKALCSGASSTLHPGVAQATHLGASSTLHQGNNTNEKTEQKENGVTPNLPIPPMEDVGEIGLALNPDVDLCIRFAEKRCPGGPQAGMVTRWLSQGFSASNILYAIAATADNSPTKSMAYTQKALKTDAEREAKDAAFLQGTTPTHQPAASRPTPSRHLNYAEKLIERDREAKEFFAARKAKREAAKAQAQESGA